MCLFSFYYKSRWLALSTSTLTGSFVYTRAFSGKFISTSLHDEQISLRRRQEKYSPSLAQRPRFSYNLSSVFNARWVRFFFVYLILQDAGFDARFSAIGCTRCVFFCLRIFISSDVYQCCSGRKIRLWNHKNHLSEDTRFFFLDWTPFAVLRRAASNDRRWSWRRVS